MRKLLLSALTLSSALVINAMEPLTAEQLAQFSIEIDHNQDGTFFRSAHGVSLSYDGDDNTKIKVSNFNGDDNTNQTLYVNWADGTVSISAMYYSMGFDDDYQTVFNFAVNADAAELTPMDSKFTSSKIVGTISENGIVFGPWVHVQVPNNFSSLTKIFSQPITTKYVKPNATMSMKRLEWDGDWENLIPYAQVDLDGKEYPDFRVYTEVTDNNLTIYHWDDNASCVKFTKKVEDGKTYYASSAKESIYNHKGKNNYVLCKLPGKTWDDVDGHTADKAEDVVSNAMENKNVLSFGPWSTIAFGSYVLDRTHADGCTVTFDQALPMEESVEPVLAATITYAAPGEKYLQIYPTAGEGASYQIDWGDGELSEAYTEADGYTVDIKSTTVKIYGDVRILRTLSGEPQDITAVDIANMPGCTGLYFPSCQLSTLDLSGVPELKVLEISNNKFTGTLDLSALGKLSTITVDGNELTNLILPENCASMYQLDCSNNKLESLNIVGATGLMEVSCLGNLMKTLTITGAPVLEELNCSENQLTSIDIAGCPELTKLTANDNKLTSVDITANTKITGLYLQDNELSELKTDGCTALSWVNLENNQLTEFDATGLSNLRNLNVVNNKLTTLDIKDSPYCGQLFVDDNQLTTLDTKAQGTSLSTFSCSGNNISSLDLSANSYLYWFIASNNELTELDLSNHAYLQRIELSNNRLTSLDISGDSGLQEVLVDNNNLDEAQLTAIVNVLPDITELDSTYDWARRLNISWNPGTSAVDTSVATNKGWEVDALSGLSNAVAADGAYAVGGEGCINIIGNAASVAVYTLAGQAVTTTNLAPAIYIVVVDGKSQKVVVR